MSTSNNVRSTWLGRYLRLQFNLQALLWATAICGVAMWWYLRPPPVVEPLAGGYQLRAPQRIVVDPQSGQEQTVRHGPLVVLDRDGRVRCRGRYVGGKASGFWVWYHANGRRQAAGYCRDDCLVGRWVVRNADGHRVQELHFGDPAQGKLPLPSYRWRMPSFPPSDDEPVIAMEGVRQGRARQWWDNGQLQSEGEFVDDRRDGPWRFWDRQGQLIADGSFRHGQRHGPWQLATSAGRRLETVHYLDGQRTVAWDQLLPSLKDRLESADWSRADQAASQLSLVGAQGETILRMALQSDAPATSMHALRHLARMEAVDPLTLAAIERLRSANDQRLRTMAVHAMYSHDAQRRAAHCDLLLRLGVDGDARLRRLVIQCFVEQPVLDLQHLERSLEDQDWRLRQFTCNLLGELLEQSQPGNPHASFPRFHAVRAVLERAAASSLPDVAETATAILDEHGEFWGYPSYPPLVTSPLPVVG